ncbi:Heparinase II/III-like [Oxalobacteraceae bacterium]
MNVMRSFVNLAQRVARRLRREVRGFFRKSRDHLISSYPAPGSPKDGWLAQHFGFLDRQFVDLLIKDFPDYPDLVRRQAENSIAHCFDLLGSGPVKVKHGSECRGLEGCRFPASPMVDADRHGNWLESRINRANLPAARRIWQLVDSSYSPIDWHLDFKSGYRWQESTWHGDIRFGQLAGVDIKVPWELSRMQHLPTLALACHFAQAGVPGFRSADTYAREFRNQVLDFMATNPPGFGVNWACAMDVGIRVANLLVARDIVVSAGLKLDDEFEAVFATSVRVHARHVAANLEWSPTFRGNHYIANIAGLLFSSVYLPCGEEADAWLAFAAHETIVEAAYQFHEDGSNFEGSVCYHRLSAEMLVWVAALLVNLAPDKRRALGRECPLPDSFWMRFANMASFTETMTRPDGLVVQFGDNDSGRFITLGSGEQLRAGNDPSSALWSLDHSALVAGIRTVLGNKVVAADFKGDPGIRMLAAIVGAGGESPVVTFAIPELKMPVVGLADDSVWVEINKRLAATADGSRWTSVFDASAPGLSAGLEFSAFNGMGCYVVRSPRLYLAVRCGEIGLAGLGGHTHCDQLAIELVLDGADRVRDPGTYIYTPLPARRNAYRSARAHHVPRVPGQEPADLGLGVFDLRGAAEGECLYFGLRGFIGRHAGYGSMVYRIIALEDTRIVVHDFAEGALSLGDPTPEPLPYSPGYGRIATA